MFAVGVHFVLLSYKLLAFAFLIEILENFLYFMLVIHAKDRLCGLVVSVEDYNHRGPGLDSLALLRIFLRELGLERGPLSLVIG
jgi:hypothetical protein